MAKRVTQLDRVRAHLNAGRRLSSWQAIQEWRITRLAALIHTLKHIEGMNITREDKVNPETGKKYAVYYCSDPVVNENQYGLFGG